MASDDLFWIASTTKPMTATALMMLVDEGKVSVEDPVEKYLPEFKGQRVLPMRPEPGAEIPSGIDASKPPVVPANHPILIREILSHTSGLRFKSSAQPGALDLLPLAEAVRSFAAEPLIFQPGTGYSYSNEGLNTAARIIEVVSGMSYEQFMQQRLFFPLGMKDTTFWPTPEQAAHCNSLRLQRGDQDAQGTADRATDLSAGRSRSPLCHAGRRAVLDGGRCIYFLPHDPQRRRAQRPSLHLDRVSARDDQPAKRRPGRQRLRLRLGHLADGLRRGGAYNKQWKSDGEERILILIVQQAGVGTWTARRWCPRSKSWPMQW